LLLASVTARADEAGCLSLPQARAAYPGKYLSYRVDRKTRAHCWGNYGSRARVAPFRARASRPAQVAPLAPPAPRLAVLWPAVRAAAEPVDAALLTPASATTFPLLLDIDQAPAPTVEAEPPCCWPPLEPGEKFSERWPSLYWFANNGGMK
jgi:hypothetical protein